MIVVYFDQQTGVQHALFPSLTEQNKEKRKESRTKTCNKTRVYQCLGVTKSNLDKITFSLGVDQRLGVNQRLRVAPKRW